MLTRERAWRLRHRPVAAREAHVASLRRRYRGTVSRPRSLGLPESTLEESARRYGLDHTHGTAVRVQVAGLAGRLPAHRLTRQVSMRLAASEHAVRLLWGEHLLLHLLHLLGHLVRHPLLATLALVRGHHLHELHLHLHELAHLLGHLLGHLKLGLVGRSETWLLGHPLHAGPALVMATPFVHHVRGYSSKWVDIRGNSAPEPLIFDAGTATPHGPSSFLVGNDTDESARGNGRRLRLRLGRQGGSTTAVGKRLPHGRSRNVGADIRDILRQAPSKDGKSRRAPRSGGAWLEQTRPWPGSVYLGRDSQSRVGASVDRAEAAGSTGLARESMRL